MASTEKTQLTPAVDIYENEGSYMVCADLPGARPDSLSVDLDAGTLTLFADRDENTAWKRVFRISDAIDAEQVTASLEYGVLRVTLPKRESLRPRRIPVALA